MGSSPTGWTTPKTNWASNDVPTPVDLNRQETNINVLDNGSRTIDPLQTPASNIGTLRQLLDWFANRIKAITGETNWYDAPDTTLSAAKSHIDATAPHTGHETPTGAQTKVDTHSALTSGIHGVGSSDVESQSGAQSKVDAHANRTDNPHNVTAAQLGLSSVKILTGSGTFASGGNSVHITFSPSFSTVFSAFGNVVFPYALDAVGVYVVHLKNLTTSGVDIVIRTDGGLKPETALSFYWVAFGN